MVIKGMSFEEFYAKLKRVAVAKALRFGYDKEDGADLCHDIIARLIEDEGLADEIESFSYLTRAIHNFFIDCKRVQGRRPTASLDVLGEWSSPVEVDVDRALEVEDLKQVPEIVDEAVASMGGNRRRAMECYVGLVMERDDEPTLEEVAERCGISVATVCRARLALRRVLGQMVQGLYVPPTAARTLWSRA